MTDPLVPRAVAEVADTALEVSVVGSFSRLGFGARRRLFGWDELPPDALRDRVALVTGASSGLGLATALGLARAGATVIALGRDRDRTEAARADIARVATHGEPRIALADLSRLADVHHAADEISTTTDRLDLVVHNAGTLVHERELTVDDLEITAQTHVVAPFLLTARLFPLLLTTPAARVITVTSGGMYTTPLDLDSLAHPPGGDRFDGVKAYARAKRAQVVLTQQWAARTARADISFQVMHPGWADTAGLRASLPRFHRLVGPMLRSPDQGVDTVLWLAAADEPLAHGGSLWLDRHRRRTAYWPGTATSATEANRLWDWCLDQAGVEDPTRSLASS